MKNLICFVSLLFPLLGIAQGFVDPCGTGLKPFDHSHQLLFDSCFRAQTFPNKKKCTISITDSMFTTGKQEEIIVTINTSGQAVQLVHVMQDAEKISCAQIACIYENDLFYSTHIQGADSAITSVFREYQSRDGKYREHNTWYQKDTMKQADVRNCFYKNLSGIDTCIKSYTKTSGTTIQYMTSITELSDSTEERIYMNINYRWNDSEGDTSYARRTVTYNKRKQIVRKEYYLFKTRAKYIWTYQYTTDGRLAAYSYKDAYGKDERFTIERNKDGLPKIVRCYGFPYYTIYRFNWE